MGKGCPVCCAGRIHISDLRGGSTHLQVTASSTTQPIPSFGELALARWLKDSCRNQLHPLPSVLSPRHKKFHGKIVPLKTLRRFWTVPKCPHIAYPLTFTCQVLDRYSKGQILSYPFPPGHSKVLHKGVAFGIPPQEGRPGWDKDRGLHQALWSNRE